MRAKLSDFDFEFDTKGQPAEAWVSEVFDTTSASVEVKAPEYFLRPDERRSGIQAAYIETYSRNSGRWVKSGIHTSKADLWAIRFGSYPAALIVDREWLKRAAALAYRLGLQQNCEKEPNPTHGVLVGLPELWKTRPGTESPEKRHLEAVADEDIDFWPENGGPP